MAIPILIRATGPLWDEATRSPYLDALAAGNLPADALRRWLAQDYLFAKDLVAFRPSCSPRPLATVTNADRDHKTRSGFPLYQGVQPIRRPGPQRKLDAGMLIDDVHGLYLGNN
jgi:hypothetical protein